MAVRLVLGLATIAPERKESVPAPTNGYEEYERQITKAEEAEANGEIETALEAYGYAYHALPGTNRASDMGCDLVDAVVRLGDVAWNSGVRSPEMLNLEITLIEEYIKDIERFQPEQDIQVYRDKRAELVEWRLSRLTPVHESDDEKGVVVEPSSNVSTAATETADDSAIEVSGPLEASTDTNDELIPEGSFSGLETPSDALDRSQPIPHWWRKAGIGLTTAGSVLIAGGIASVAYAGWMGEAIDDRYSERVTDCGANVTCLSDIEAWRDDNFKLRRGVLAGGIVTTVVGVGLLASGVILIVKHRKDSPNRVAWGPVLMPHHYGVAWHGRF